MKKYVFYDADETGFEEYDIRGEAYELLMQTCFRYSSVISLEYMDTNMESCKKMQKFEIDKPTNMAVRHQHHGHHWQTKYYKLCPELCSILLDVAGGIFEWIDGWGFKNPEDPVFYRSDGTIFFDSVIHEGICAIMPREDEDVRELLQAVTWCTGDDIRWYPTI